MPTPVSVVWFRQDLRLSDNPALTAAVQAGEILPIYILDDVNAGDWKMGAASRVWLHSSLDRLNDSLGGQLRYFEGDAVDVLQSLIASHPIRAVHWNRCYEPWRQTRDARIEQVLEPLGVSCHSHNGSLLWEPEMIAKPNGEAYRVFTPFWKNSCLRAPEPALPLPVPEKIAVFASEGQSGPGCATLAQRLQHPWQEQVIKQWDVGESAALRRLGEFCETTMSRYFHQRDYPATQGTSRLSPHLHFGEISPRQAWHRARQQALHGSSTGVDTFLCELGWREFSYYLLCHHPTLPDQNHNRRFDNFKWQDDAEAQRRWQRGMTGYPLIDAGMRELWQTGYMHNRVRMVVASFLIKNQLQHWRTGARWFWDCLLDADLASNSASWQWCAGTGADAAPYFRIFNPVTQSEKFDPQGEYIVRFCPELEPLPTTFRHRPWQADTATLNAAGLVLGTDYPLPILDVKTTRERALDRFRALP